MKDQYVIIDLRTMEANYDVFVEIKDKKKTKKMESYRLYEIKIETLEKEINSLKIELGKQDLIKLGYKEEISKWNKKYKDLKNQMMGKD